MSNIAIKAENLGKAYQLGQIGTGTISRDIERWYAKMRGKEDPFLRIGEANDRSKAGTSDIVWSLRDINFEIEQGDAVGIIGRNGAGKSTLLKILSKVTAPTTGKISGKGRIASLLEVGTGFHPELSGRENIFLNGAILGMRRKEIQRKFDEIVDFAGIERYIDTPVKRYSSGMYVRLAFAVAAHLESEILIVDEVLAVGDAEFQEKCLGKMGDVSKGEGRTVLFVSHNMGSIKQLCSKGMVLENGMIGMYDAITPAINYYSINSKPISLNISGPLTQYLEFTDVKINNRRESNLSLSPNEAIEVELQYKVKEDLNDATIIIALFSEGVRLTTIRNADTEKPTKGLTYSIKYLIPAYTLRPGNFSLAIGGWGNGEMFWAWGLDVLNFKLDEMWSIHQNKEDEGIITIPVSSKRAVL